MNKAEGGSTFCILMVDDDPTIRKFGKGDTGALRMPGGSFRKRT